MKLLGSFVIACSMYSRIPMPGVAWTKERMQYAMCFFPFVGIVIGAAVCLYGCLLRFWMPGNLACAVILTILPFAVCGGLHMDGFLDVMDAKSSCKDREKKLEILKDPHTGAFAAISGALYLLCYVAVCSEIPTDKLHVYAGIYVLERALSGFSVICFPKAKKDGLAATFSSSAKSRVSAVAMICWLAAAFGWISFFGGLLCGLVCLAAGLLCLAYYYRMALREFGGVTGDLAGYFLQCCELGLLLAVTICLRI